MKVGTIIGYKLLYDLIIKPLASVGLTFALIGIMSFFGFHDMASAILNGNYSKALDTPRFLDTSTEDLIMNSIDAAALKFVDYIKQD